jgi:hypothetical protein
MDRQQMNEYLESIGGLKNGFYNDRPPIKNANFFSVDQGWYPLIKDLIDDLIKLDWNKQVCQVKEKFGGLRFYINEGSDQIFKRITQAENDSYTICEVTGKPGELRTDLGWHTTLCDEEYEKRKKRNENRRV